MLLNITGGGKIRLEHDVELIKVKPSLIVDKNNAVDSITDLINARYD